MRSILLAATCAAAMLVTQACNAASIKPIARGYALKLEGDIGKGDDKRLISAYAQGCAKYGHCPERVFLNSPGGYMLQAVYLGEAINQLQLDTVVNKGDVCASACFVAFAAGIHRVMRVGGFLGVHQSHSAVTGQVIASDQQAVAEILEGWGVPQKIIYKMITTGPDDMAWLHEEDGGAWIETLN